MKKLTTLLGFTVAATCFNYPKEALAQVINLTARCKEERHDGQYALGRVKWAVRCGYASGVDFHVANRVFPIFSNVQAPIDEWADCGNYDGAIGMCKWGCYVPSQTVMFGEREIPFTDALDQGVSTVTSLADLDVFHGNAIRLMEQTIGEVTEGSTQEEVYRITSTSGRELVVSAKHPVIDESGKVISADRVVAGEAVLLGKDESHPIASVEKELYTGKLYNISPKSDQIAHNILIANGFLTGSLRYQNEWSKDENRLYLRRQLNVN